jgi:hypothetical protein
VTGPDAVIYLDLLFTQINLNSMEAFISYFSLVALILVLILLTWAIILIYQEKTRKVTARSRLAELRKKVEALPEDTEEDKSKKAILHRELHLEYLDNILGEIEKIRAGLAKRAKEGKKSKGRK